MTEKAREPGGKDLVEKEYVNRCPSCGTRFIGMTPKEVRTKHAEDCTEILQLVVFPKDV